MLGQVEQSMAGVPTTTVAAIFQKEMLVLLAHPDVGCSRTSRAGRCSCPAMDGAHCGHG